MIDDDAARDDDVPGGELHAATVATVDPGTLTCTVTIPALDGGAERKGPVRYLPVSGTHPARGQECVVLEDAAGRLWLGPWAPGDLGPKTTGLAGIYSSATHAAGATISIPAATHGLGTGKAKIISTFVEATGERVYADETIAANGDVTITFGASQAANTIRTTIVG